MYKIIYTKQAAKDAENIKRAGLDKKVRAFIEILRKDPFQTPPPYEGLIGSLKGAYSRRINIQHRLVYQIDATPFEENGVFYQGWVKVIRMWTHYE